MAVKSVWILNHYAATPWQLGGTRHYDIASELVKRGYYIKIFASSYNHFSKEEMLIDGRTAKEEAINNVNFVWVKTWPKYKSNGLARLLNMVSYCLQMMRIYKRYEKPNIIIGSSVHLFACLAAYWIAGRTGAKFLCEIRDLWPQTLIDMGAISKNHPLAVIFRFIERLVYKKADKIIVLLPNAYEYIKQFDVEKEYVVYIPNGVNINEFDKCLHEYEIGDSVLSRNTFNCTYVGSHGAANKLQNVLDAAKIVAEKGYHYIKFYLVGEGPEKKVLIDYKMKLGIDNVVFLDYVEKKFVPSLLSQSDIHIFNLKKADVFKYGISSNKLFDYMCSGKPIIFACSTSNNIIEEAKAGISVPPEDPSALADAVVELYEAPEEKRIQMGMNGIKYVERYHSTSCLVDKLEKCFD